MKTKLVILLQLLCAATVMAQNVTFGIISDVHQDLQKDAAQRLSKFLEVSKKQKPDFIISLGDLSHSTGADSILKIWNSYAGQKYNVFGNHDMDHSNKAIMTAKYGMPASYYSFDNGGVHFVVLDCCFTRKNGKLVDYQEGNYFVKAADRDLISDEQLEWLAKDLAKTTYPTIIFSHQAFDEIGASVPNREAVRSIVRQANQESKGKVAAMICGHHHIDAHSVIDDVHYFQINSASYLWIESPRNYSNGKMAEYKDPLYAFVTVNPKRRTITIKGVESEFKAPAPQADQFSAAEWATISPSIRDRKVSF